MAGNITKEKNSVVSASSEVTEDYTPANGEKVYIYHAEGSAVYANNVKCQIGFGDDIIFVTHGDKISQPKRIITGDGSTPIRILLDNDSGSNETLSCKWEGSIL